MPMASEIAAFLGARLDGADISVERVSSLVAPVSGSILFSERRSKGLPERLGAALLALEDLEFQCGEGNALIMVPNPRLAFALVVERYFAPRKSSGISPKAHIEPGVLIGQGCRVEPGAVIEEDVVLGDGSIVGYNAVILRGCRIGQGCVVGPNAVLGGEGLSTATAEDGSHSIIRHTGKLRIANDVEIGACTTIQRGTIDDTVIEQNVKISPNVNVGHNCRVGKRSMIASGACLCGSCRVGDDCFVGAGAVIRDHVQVGSKSFIGMQATVVESVGDGGKVVGMTGLSVMQLARLKNSFGK